MPFKFGVAAAVVGATFLIVANCCAQTDYFLQALAGGSRQCISAKGGQMPDNTGTFTLDYWNTPEVLSPGQRVTNQISFTVTMGNNPNAVVYKTVLAEWQTNAPIAVLQNGILEGSPGTTVTNFGFTAPTTPGTYRIRLAMTWAYQGIQHFYGDGPAGDAWNPGVGHWAEITIRVVAPPTTDYFLQALASGARQCLSADGGQMPFDSGSLTINYWSTPKVVSPGQRVTNEVSYAVAGSFNGSAVTFKTVLAEWQTNTPIAVLENGVLQGSPRTIVMSFGFTAPTIPGLYRIRLAMTWAFLGIQRFYGDGPLGDAWNPGVGQWAEVTIRVVAPPTNDYFLQALASGTRQCISANGGQMPYGSGTFILNYWNTPALVGPGQRVTNQVSFTVPTGNNPNAVVYKTVLAEWQTNAPIAVLQNGMLEGSPGTTEMTFGYTAPATPGVYRIRLAMTWAYQGIQRFYGDGPAGDAFNPGVGQWAEITVRVAAPVSLIYAQDFSSDPGWITDDPTKLHCDAASGTFHGTQVNSEGTYAYVQLPSFNPNNAWRLEWDHRINSDQWSAGLTFGLMDSRLSYPYGAGLDMGIAGPGPGMSMWCGDATPPGTFDPPWSVGTWYHSVLAWDPLTQQLTLDVTNRDAGTLYMNLNAAVTSFPADMTRLGVTRVWVRNNPSGTSPSATVDYDLDNIRFYASEAAPVLLAPLPATTASLGSSLNLCASASGTEPLSYQWYFNGSLLAGDTASCLTLDHLQANQGGLYSIVTTNAFGSITNSLTLALSDLRMYAGLSLYGAPGSTYRIECKENLSQANWTALTNITMLTSPCFWLDSDSPNHPSRFYRFVPLP